MSVFRKKQEEQLVAAKQWSPETDTEDDPVALETDAVTGRKYGLLHTKDGGQVPVNPGDYVLNFPDGSWDAMSPDEFAKAYEPTEKASAKKLATKAGE